MSPSETYNPTRRRCSTTGRAARDHSPALRPQHDTEGADHRDPEGAGTPATVKIIEHCSGSRAPRVPDRLDSPGSEWFEGEARWRPSPVTCRRPRFRPFGCPVSRVRRRPCLRAPQPPMLSFHEPRPRAGRPPTDRPAPAIVAAGRSRTSYGTSSRSSIPTFSPEIGSVAATTRVLSPSASTGSRTTVKVRTMGAPSAIA